MGLWGRAAPGIKMGKLERQAARAEQLILAMTPEARAAALDQVLNIAQAIAGLKALPDELADLLGRLAVDFLVEQKLASLMKTSSRALVLQIVKGAPTLLGPHRERIEALIDGP